MQPHADQSGTRDADDLGVRSVAHDTPMTGVYRRVAPVRPVLSPGMRLLAGILAAMCFAVLFTAFRLTPAPAGLGTHEQLGLPPCMWMAKFGKPCMTCGMTTSFSHAAHGHFIASFLAQPMGLILALCTAAMFWLALNAALNGARVDVVLAPLIKPKRLWWPAGGMLAAWVYKIVIS